MKNITLKIDDETYKNARIRAASLGTSVSAMVRDFLSEISTSSSFEVAPLDYKTSHEKRVADLEAFFAEIDAKSKTLPTRTEPLKPMTREEIYAERIH